MAFVCSAKCRTLSYLMLSIVIHIAVRNWQNGKNEKANSDIEYFFVSPLNRAILWGSKYKAVINFPGWMQDNKRDSEDVSLVTQCSVNNLHHLPEMAARWRGPVSIAVFAPQIDFVKAVFGIYVLKECFWRVFKDAMFHLVYPVGRYPMFDYQEYNKIKKIIKYARVDSFCSIAMTIIQNFEGGNYVMKGIQYPHNTLRNVAISSVTTKYVLVLDVDTFPALDIRKQFLRFVKTESYYFHKKNVFVVPAFEAKMDIKLPRSKTELVKEYKKGNVRPFHNETCRNCHQPTRYFSWISILENKDLTISYGAEWKDSWEPFYIADKDIPRYNESFKQYGFDRISQVCETYVAGYAFFVLNNAFVVHEGFKRPNDFHSSKNAENKRNYKIYLEEFVPNLSKKYPDSKRTCVGESKREGISHSKFRPHFKVTAEKNEL